MKYSNFLFSGSRDSTKDGQLIDEAIREAQLCDQLGFDTLWLAEHHFDGICSYVDPVSFAAALAASTERIKIGFAVAQMSLHHPIRFAEQVSLLDNISKGRIVVGLGRGTSHNIYDYQGYGIDPNEAQGRLLESEAVMLKAWTTEDLVHCGEFFDIRLPKLRPEPFTKPHPPVIRACSGEASVVDMARQGRPFMMNVQSNDVTAQRIATYREAMGDAGYSEADIQDAVEQCWVWRNIFVAESDEEAARIALPAFEHQNAFRKEMRERIYRERGETISKHGGKAPARNRSGHAVICGSPETVRNALADIEAIGVGGVILQFRIGDMDYAHTERSLELFMAEVA